MAVMQSGDIVQTNEILWAKTDLDDSYSLTSQGDVACDNLGVCVVSMSSASLVAGEIYELVMYSYSFKIVHNSLNYYLFGTSASEV